MKTLQLHYTMIQFLIIYIIPFKIEIYLLKSESLDNALAIIVHERLDHALQI